MIAHRLSCILEISSITLSKGGSYCWPRDFQTFYFGVNKGQKGLEGTNHIEQKHHGELDPQPNSDLKLAQIWDSIELAKASMLLKAKFVLP